MQLLLSHPRPISALFLFSESLAVLLWYCLYMQLLVLSYRPFFSCRLLDRLNRAIFIRIQILNFHLLQYKTKQNVHIE